MQHWPCAARKVSTWPVCLLDHDGKAQGDDCAEVGCQDSLLALLTCTDGGAVCDHIWLESALPHLPKKPECRCPLAGLSCRGRWPGPSAATKAMLLATSGWHRCAGLTCTDVVFMYALLRVIGQLFEQLPHVWDICARYEWEWGGQLLG